MLMSVLFIGIIPIIFIIIFLTFGIMKVDSQKLYNLYLAVVSFVSVIAIAITLGVVLTAFGKFLIISDDEFIENSRSYEMRQCEEPKLVSGKDERLERTPEEITQCKENVKDSAIKSRRYRLKDMFISSGAWTIVFAILFAFHYPKFLKNRNN